MIDIIAREKGSLKWHHETFIFRFEHYVTFPKRMAYLDTSIKHPIFYITLELLILVKGNSLQLVWASLIDKDATYLAWP